MDQKENSFQTISFWLGVFILNKLKIILHVLDDHSIHGVIYNT